MGKMETPEKKSKRRKLNLGSGASASESPKKRRKLSTGKKKRNNESASRLSRALEKKEDKPSRKIPIKAARKSMDPITILSSNTASLASEGSELTLEPSPSVVPLSNSAASSRSHPLQHAPDDVLRPVPLTSQPDSSSGPPPLEKPNALRDKRQMEKATMEFKEKQIRDLKKELVNVNKSELKTRHMLDEYKQAIEKWQIWKNEMLEREKTMESQKAALVGELEILMTNVDAVKSIMYKDQMNVWHSRCQNAKQRAKMQLLFETETDSIRTRLVSKGLHDFKRRTVRPKVV